ncbi:MAG TPA: hypothetical protein VNA13_04930, partial [Xanthomonadales bacterium]|nr:hypothetical protein [Xanthomonadales bacterium]
MRNEVVENVGQPNGIPETWLRSLVDANSSFPVGFPVMAQAMAPVLFRSLITGEVSLMDLANLKPNKEQLHRLEGNGNRQHDEFNVSHRVSTNDLSRRWSNDIGYFTDLAIGTLDWLNEEKFEKTNNPHVLDDLTLLDKRSKEFDELLKDPKQKEKL